MAKPGNEFRVEMDVNVGREPMVARPLPDTPFRIALIGDFGAGARKPGRQAVVIDRDNVDEVVAALAPVLDLKLDDGSQISIHFSALDDFHPDRLYERLGIFASLRELRRRLADPGTFAETARQLRGEPATREAPRVATGDLLDQILSVNESAEEKFEAAGGDLHGFIQRIMAPHLVAHTDPRQAQMVADVDTAIGATMRTMLHHPDFQSLESAWRSASLLAMRIETSSMLEVALIDLPRSQLSGAAALDLLRASATDDRPWSLLVGLYTLGDGPDEAALLGELAATAAQLGAPWLSGAHPSLIGCESIAGTPDPAEWQATGNPAWSVVRRSPLARSLGLALPRFLLRLPYGKQTEQCERFAFEEMPGNPSHEGYLWGNPAAALAILIGQAFADGEWRFQPGRHLDLTGLPLHLFKVNGVSYATPCAETLLSERATERILDLGLMPLASVKEQDAARLVRLQSVAEPPAPLAGRWTHGA